MENGFSTSDAILTQAMSGGFGNNRGAGDWGGGYGYGAGNQVLASEAHANGTAVSAKADCNAQRFSDGLNSLSDQFANVSQTAKFDRLNENISDQEFRSSAALTAITKDLADSEFRTIDRNRDIERLLVQNAQDAAKCCCDAQLLAQQNACDTQKLILSEGNETRALILAVESRANVASLAVAQARITQLETIDALSRRGNGGS